MKINFRNKAARLIKSKSYLTCKRCPFAPTGVSCPFGTSTIVDCNCKGWWVSGEALGIFKI